ncbi:AbrB/MazE/SpoVT family DNA-binding domain-containing protein [Paenibacillus chitinolyticus]|uniref:AbrB/MazE/SpoVT family DNA-binding domain-containing protein n=1 Tax=Paenibacillus chitinolyticus TaxID=79263 RepID=UPI001C472C3E|nr:AbrB/MazE/SpoVT family DNA-binding domain-containing protein [Paenibacillus chitinolyticus]MBV6717270.1 AbrB/MazE/SpoVT family DNA-binding domain-containing protein [Paenibacillus chitinolyticus]
MKHQDKPNNGPLYPTDAHTLKLMIVAILEKSLDNMDRLRDREQVLQLIETLKSPTSVMGKVRRIVSTGVIRQTDGLGRVTVPRALRRSLGLSSGTPAEVYLEGEYIVIQPYKQFCLFCGSEEDINEFKEKYVCETCVGDLFKIHEE